MVIVTKSDDSVEMVKIEAATVEAAKETVALQHPGHKKIETAHLPTPYPTE